MPWVHIDELKRMQQAHHLLASHGYDITNALRDYARRLAEASQKHQAAYDAGTDTPLVTNYGYLVMAELLSTKANQATGLANEIESWGTVTPEAEEKPAPPVLPGRLRRPPARPAWSGPCGCACSSGDFCGGCGHAGCGGRR